MSKINSIEIHISSYYIGPLTTEKIENIKRHIIRSLIGYIHLEDNDIRIETENDLETSPK
jgi:hypothetical protein